MDTLQMDVLNRQSVNKLWISYSMDAPACFSRFYKRKQIADFLFASLGYKALPICLTLKKKILLQKGAVFS